MIGSNILARKIPLLISALCYYFSKIFYKGSLDFKGSAYYWETRYRFGGTSGPGSYNRLAEYKAEVINDFIQSHPINSVIEFGCGDGSQLKRIRYPRYVGVDVAPKAIKLCRRIFAHDATKTFFVASDDRIHHDTYDLALSLDVIFHLIEDEVYQDYMCNLFSASQKYVIIYSSNYDQLVSAPHVRHRAFTQWIESNQPSWTLIKYEKNKYPYNPNNPENTSFSDFFIYVREPSTDFRSPNLVIR